MSKPDLVSVIEAAYRVEKDDRAWLAGVLEQVDKTLGRGLGTCGFFLDASNLAAIRTRGLDRSRLKIDLDPRVFSVGSPADLEPYYGRQAAGTGSGQVGVRKFRQSHFYTQYYRPAGAEDVLGLIGIDSSGVGCVVALPCTKTTKLNARETLAYSRLAAHIATGNRVRTGMPAGKPIELRGEAVLDVRGKTLHADGPAQEPRSREALRHLAQQIDRARTKLRRSDVDEAVAVWTALVEGRWTLLDHFDSDGRRLLVARRNEPDAPAHAALSLRERQVLAFTALGHSGKLVSYELGLPQGAVSRHLASAMAKLGIRGRAELATALARLAQAAVAEASVDGPSSSKRSGKRSRGEKK